MRRFLIFILLFACLQSADARAKTPMLSLDEAILLAVRDNPNVQSANLNLVTQKFALWVQEWEFYPHYALTAAASTNRHKADLNWVGGHNVNVQPSATLLTPIGTQLTLSATNSKTINYNPGVAFNFVQPLMRGFGRACCDGASRMRVIPSSLQG